MLDNWPNPAIIPKPGHGAGMIRIGKHFPTLLMSALIADSDIAIDRWKVIQGRLHKRREGNQLFLAARYFAIMAVSIKPIIFEDRGKL
jgi:hypothetical protein